MYIPQHTAESIHKFKNSFTCILCTIPMSITYTLISLCMLVHTPIQVTNKHKSENSHIITSKNLSFKPSLKPACRVRADMTTYIILLTSILTSMMQAFTFLHLKYSFQLFFFSATTTPLHFLALPSTKRIHIL